MPARSAVLTGLSLATGIAREATDAVPIVKQVLGVASRIVGLAEQVDKNREDLHALVERARTMDTTLAAVVGDHELNGVVIRRLEAVNAVLRDIETWFASHIKRGRVRTSLGYIFTVRKDVERLKGQFDDCLKELEIAANMDTNIVARGESRFIGEFRNIRHCEINLLRHLPHLTRSGAGYTFNYHSATCEGSNEVFVVRYTVECEGNDDDIDERLRVEANERILERMSLIQNRHPNVAYLYGRNNGPRDSRFIVLKVGDIRPLDDVIGERSADLDLFGQIAEKLVDASCHLQKHGAQWMSGQHIYVDNNYEPRIGMHNGMCCMTSESTPATLAALALVYLFDLYTASAHTAENHFPSPELRSSGWTMQLFGHLIDAGYRTVCQENSIRPAEIASRIPFSKESWMYLQHADDSIYWGTPFWGTMLAALALGTKKREGHILHAVYRVSKSEKSDLLRVWTVDDDVDTVYHTETHFEIPRSSSNEVLRRLGIDVTACGQKTSDMTFDLQRIAGPGAMSPTCTGWTRYGGRWSPWWCPIRHHPERHREQFDWDDPTYVQRAEIRAGEDEDLCDTIL